MAFTKKGKAREYKRATQLDMTRTATALLAKDNFERSRTEKKNKKKSYEDMIKTIPYKLYKPELFVRNPEDWVSKSHNVEKQKLDFLKWIYCKYKTPHFMFSVFEKTDGNIYKNPYRRTSIASSKLKYPEEYIELFFDWFISIAQGKSFYKRHSEFFSRKESHIFVNIKNNKNILENYWLCKCEACGLNMGLTYKIVSIFSTTPEFMLRWSLHEFIKFSKRFEDDIDLNGIHEVIDYVRSKSVEKTFSLKGRSLSSLIKHSNEWHKELQKIKFGDSNKSWSGIGIDSWKYVEKADNVEITWNIKELLTSKDLYKEGRALKHCVASYVGSCTHGSSNIFSLTNDDVGRVATIEVSKYLRIIQIKCVMNRPPSAHALKIVYKWAQENNIKKS